jgi:cytidylate kinase
MRIDLVQYLKSSYLEKNAPAHEPGPVITISREAGCPGKKISQHLMEVLNQKFVKPGSKELWKWVGKEIFMEAAKELELEPDQVRKVFKEPRTIMGQIVSSTAQKFYKSDRQVRETIGQVIRAMGEKGHVIILGLGGISLSRDLPKSLHISLEAPLEWRAISISEKHCCSPEEAKKIIIKIDRRRDQYRNYYQGKGTDYTSFDIRFNCMTLSIEEIVEEIVRLMEIRMLV